MSGVSSMIRELLENGVHFGHQTNKWNPKMGKYIFGEKSGIYIIDLKKTEKALIEARDFVEGMAREGKALLFVGTKKQAKTIIREEALRCGMFFVNERWLGGCLTNFNTIRKSVDRLNQIQEMKTTEVFGSFAKKEKARIDREEYKLLKNLAGIREMKALPACLIVVDAEAELISIKEARKIGIPVIALVDTNCDPNIVDFPIPGNDDAIRSIKYIVSTLTDAVVGARAEFDGVKVAAAPVEGETVAESMVVEEVEAKPEPEPEKPELVIVAEEKKETVPVEEIRKEVPEEREKGRRKKEEEKKTVSKVSDEVAEGDIRLSDEG